MLRQKIIKTVAHAIATVRKQWPLALILACTLPTQAWAQAEGYPNKPIRIIVPYSAGSATDILARTIGQKLTDAWGQPVVVDARPGAGGSIGTEAAAKSPADGYTLVMGTNATFGINVSLYNKLPYDPVKDFTPIALLANLPYMVLAHPSFPANSIPELVAMAKAQPGKLDLAGGVSTAQLATELLNSMAGIKLTYIPYKSTPPALSDVLAAQVLLLIADPAVALSHIRSGKLKVLGVTASKRIGPLPEVPTLAEMGLPGYDVVAWWGVMAPAGTPKDIVTRLNGELLRILRMPDVKERLAGMGIEPLGSSPEQLGAYVQAEIPKWAKAVKAAGIQPQ
jgi:tripartite-type tricarboxylate transporter receptor subunit TctC